jgi:2-polyprenyl-3-methyl-5-hydroxy-6-metoxy-1,4-benzoquinol methylase
MTGSAATHSASSDSVLQHSREVAAGERFEFGKNWAAFLRLLDDDRIERAESSLAEMLQVKTLDGRTFLDIGSGSGLFSLAARRLGAQVTSFDFDPNSVACTNELRRRYFPDDPQWKIEHGSILDEDFVGSLEKYDVVYSWGVLHHTGDMWKALSATGELVRDRGQLFIAIYNDTGSQAARWKAIKATYCRLPNFLKFPFAVAVSLPGELKSLAGYAAAGKPFRYFAHWRNYRNARGMNRWHDILDWVGGYPYEYAGPSKLFRFFADRGFSLANMKCDNVGLGCNELVFRKDGGPGSTDAE